MDLNFPRPMLNSPAESGTAAGNAFYRAVQDRVQTSRDLREAVVRWAYVSAINKAVPDYADIVRQINICLAEIRPHVPMAELTQMLLTTPTEEIENLLKKLQKMRPRVQ
jgi:hypothetical protein